MLRYLRLYIAFWRNGLRQAVEFRANFWANVLTNLGWVFSLVVFLTIIFRNTHSVAGWTEPQMFILFGTYSLVRGLCDTIFYGNLSQMPLYIRQGTMDFILTKPVNSQFYASFRYIHLEELGQTLSGLAVVVYGWSKFHHGWPSATALGMYALLVICGMALFYALNMLLMTFSFWFVRLDNLIVLADTVFGIARNPIDIWAVFGPLPRFFLTYVLPLAFLASMPVRALFGIIPLGQTALSALGITMLFLGVSVLFWRKATQSYSSASS
jgi:ABC-2 type transport system permease protein